MRQRPKKMGCRLPKSILSLWLWLYEQITPSLLQGVRQTLRKVGFIIKRQQGSHIILRRDDPFAQVVVPEHKELDGGTLPAIIRQAELS